MSELHRICATLPLTPSLHWWKCQPVQSSTMALPGTLSPSPSAWEVSIIIWLYWCFLQSLHRSLQLLKIFYLSIATFVQKCWVIQRGVPSVEDRSFSSSHLVWRSRLLGCSTEFHWVCTCVHLISSTHALHHNSDIIFIVMVHKVTSLL